MTILTILYFIIGLSILILFHEFGHFICAKIFGVYVYEFSLFMGPKLFQFKKGETKYTIRLLPIGGYCSMAGEEDEQSERNEEELASENKEEKLNIPVERTLVGIKGWKKIIIMAAGGLTNIILCFFLLLIYFGTIKSPTVKLSNDSILYTQVFNKNEAYIDDFTFSFYEGEFYKDEENASSHLQGVVGTNGGIMSSNDIFSIYESGVDYIYQRFSTIEGYGLDYDIKTINLTAKLSFNFDGEVKEYTYPFNLNLNEEKTKLINYQTLESFGLSSANKHYSFGKVLGLSASYELELAGMIYKALGQLFTKEGMSNVTGVVGMYSIAKTYMAEGFSYFIFFLAMISVNLGIMNLLPFPALDGSKIVITLYEMITKKKANKKVEGIINTVGFMILLALMVIITIKDIVHPIV